ncbi:MAG TPA: RNA methyltransferase [Candidatus Cybelea sp.]|nr:RNA methyltransferase [Candidatus Cybelea sp.]
MATRLGTHAARLTAVRALRSVKGRRELQRFAFEGATLLKEAATAGFPIAELYATAAAYDATPLLRELELAGTPAFIVAESAIGGISDVATPSGIVAVAPVRLRTPPLLFRNDRSLVLADLNDPGNAGTLLRSADAFDTPAVIFGALGVDPYHPKVVRGSMGAIFRLAIAVAGPAEGAAAAAAAGVRMLGLAAAGSPLDEEAFAPPVALVVGHERRGLGTWEGHCERVLAIPMQGRAESLSAAVAGSIALYEAARAKLSRQSFGLKKSRLPR